jgi:hypothetical protein
MYGIALVFRSRMSVFPRALIRDRQQERTSNSLTVSQPLPTFWTNQLCAFLETS